MPDPNAITVHLDRLLDPLTTHLNLESARFIANLRADSMTQARVEELADKANEGRLSAEERAEYEMYVVISSLIGVIQAKARALLARGHAA